MTSARSLLMASTTSRVAASRIPEEANVIAMEKTVNQLEEPNSRRAKLIGQVHIEGYADCPHKKSSYGQYCGIPKELLCFFHEQHLFPKIIHSMRDHRWIICKSDNFKGHVFSYAEFVQIG